MCEREDFQDSRGSRLTHRVQSIFPGLSLALIGCYCLLHATSRFSSDSTASLASYSLEIESRAKSPLSPKERTRVAREHLLTSLNALADLSHKFAFGHEEDNFYGQNWSYQSTRLRKRTLNLSDVYTDVENYPVVFGYDAEDFISGIPLMEYASWAAHKGAVITFLWSAPNPYTDGGEDDVTCGGYNLLEEIMPGGIFNDKWTSSLDILGVFFNNFTFKGTYEPVPFIFRPFHEMNGNWYWWGTDCNSPESFIRAFNYTRWYFEDHLGLDQIVWMFTPSSPSTESVAVSNFKEYYPGSASVDIVAFDRYSDEELYLHDMRRDCHIMSEFAAAKGKLFTISETGITGGIQNIKNKSWFHSDFSAAIREKCSTAIYALTFSDYDSSKYWIPLDGQDTYHGFVKMYDESDSVFLYDSLWQNSVYYSYVQDSS